MSLGPLSVMGSPDGIPDMAAAISYEERRSLPDALYGWRRGCTWQRWAARSVKLCTDEGSFETLCRPYKGQLFNFKFQISTLVLTIYSPLGPGMNEILSF